MSAEPISARIYPAGILTVLSRMEVERLHDASRGKLGDLLRRCALAVLNSGNEGDDAEAVKQKVGKPKAKPVVKRQAAPAAIPHAAIAGVVPMDSRPNSFHGFTSMRRTSCGQTYSINTGNLILYERILHEDSLLSDTVGVIPAVQPGERPPLCSPWTRIPFDEFSSFSFSS